MKRRHCLQSLGVMGASAWSGWAQAHHGWSSFDQERPLYLEGKVVEARWRNPHAELVVELPEQLSLPGDLSTRKVPPQTAPVDTATLLGKAVLPRRRDPRWEVELAPLFRLGQWRLDEIPVGTLISVVGFGLRDERQAMVRAEFLFVGDRAFALRSSPA